MSDDNLEELREQMDTLGDIGNMVGVGQRANQIAETKRQNELLQQLVNEKEEAKKLPDCPVCREKIQVGALVCPHCRTELMWLPWFEGKSKTFGGKIPLPPKGVETFLSAKYPPTIKHIVSSIAKEFKGVKKLTSHKLTLGVAEHHKSARHLSKKRTSEIKQHLNQAEKILTYLDENNTTETTVGWENVKLAKKHIDNLVKRLDFYDAEVRRFERERYTKVTFKRKLRATGMSYDIEISINNGAFKKLESGMSEFIPAGHLSLELRGGMLKGHFETNLVAGRESRIDIFFSEWGALGGGLQAREAT